MFAEPVNINVLITAGNLFTVYIQHRARLTSLPGDSPPRENCIGELGCEELSDESILLLFSAATRKNTRPKYQIWLVFTENDEL